MNGRRPGAALVLALLMLVVLDCIVIGTLHLSLQEHRIGGNRTMLLQLRLDAESAARRSLAFWSAGIDSMQVGSEHRLDIPEAGTGTASVAIERLGDHLFLLRSVAAEPAPRIGRSAAQLLLTPPALAPDLDPSPAPLSAGGAVHVHATGIITAAAPSGCPAPATAHSMLVANPFDLIVDPAARFDAPVGTLDPHSISATFDRVAALARTTDAVTIVNGDTTLTATASPPGPGRVLIVTGDLTLAAGATFTGLIIAGASIDIGAGATVHGAVHTRGTATISGEIHADPCAVADAVEASGIGRPAPAGPRPWLPAF